MERWISQQLAAHFRVWANYEFVFPGKFFLMIAEQVDSRLSAEGFDRGQMQWRFEALLRNIDEAAFAPVQNYLSDSNPLKRFQFAQKLAQQFDQYQIMRPDVVQAWQQGKCSSGHHAEHWQQKLWSKLTEQFGNNHRGALWLKTIDKLNNLTKEDFSGELPKRLSIFGINTMPPLFIELLQSLANHTDVHLYLLNPAASYWADLESKKQRAKRKLKRIEQGKEAIEIFATGHPLLASLGQQGREFQEILLEIVEFKSEFESFEAVDNGNLSNLHKMQNDILQNRLDACALDNDHSISIHSCHSRMREVEVLKDQLLHTLENYPQIELRDIAVMAPDIQLYAPYVSAVFDDIPHAIADRSIRAQNQVLEAFISFLRISLSRFGWQSVLELLEQPFVYPGFGLIENDLEKVRYWLSETEIRWGRSANHRKQLGLPAIKDNSWRSGMERLLMGFAMADDRTFVDGILPFSEVEGSSAQALGGLSEFVELMFSAAEALRQPKPLKQWAQQLCYYTSRLFSSLTAENAEYRELHRILSELAEYQVTTADSDMTIEVIIAWLESTFSERKSVSGFLRGQITFCSILPMRSIPFKVIALLGMNEGEFPRIERNKTFDLLAHSYRKGDRSARSDDRYQFLEILLSARDKLFISYVGQSIQQNKALAPSVVVVELLEILENHYQLVDLVVCHPLQPFSHQYFDGESDFFSYSHNSLETAEALTIPPTNPGTWWQGEVVSDPTETIEIQDFFAFFQNPQRYFVRKILSLGLIGIGPDTEERELFKLDGLDNYHADHLMIESQLTGQSLTVDYFQAKGRWPLATPGYLLLAKKETEIAEFVESIRAKEMRSRLDDRYIEIELAGIRLVGTLSNLYESGSMIYRYANMKGKDYMRAFLHHLIINQVNPQPTWLLCKDRNRMFQPQTRDVSVLEKWLDIYLAGQTQPSYFFVEPALAYVEQARKANKQVTPMEKARQQLMTAIQSGYEAELNLLYGNMDNVGELLDERFEAVCTDLLQPNWNVSAID